MASIRERGGRYHVQVRKAGFPTRTASFSTKRKAERWATTIEADMEEGRHFRNVEARRRTLAEAITRYLDEEVPQKRNGAMHRSVLPWWRDRIGHLKLAEITPAIITEQRGKLLKEPYRRARPKSKRSLYKDAKAPEYKRKPGTVNRFLEALGHVLTVCRKEWHWISHNPMEGVSKLRESKGRVRYLSTEERAALLKRTAKNPTLHSIVVLALATAARAGELVKALRWRDVDLQEGRLLLRETKNAEPRAVWIGGEALRLLKDHAKVRPLDSDSLVFAAPGGGPFDYHEPFCEAVKAAGIADFRFHDLRHSAATYLAMEGATEAQLRAIGGWKSGAVRKYVHIASTDARDVVEKMNKKILGDGEA